MPQPDFPAPGSRAELPAAPAPPGATVGDEPDAETLFQGLPWGVVVLDAQGTVRRLNRQAAHWWGAAPAQLLGQLPGPATAGTLPPAVQRALRLVPDTPLPVAAFFLPQHRQWVKLTSVREADCWVVYWQDVTAQQQQGSQRQTREADHEMLRRRTEAVAGTGSYELDLATGQFQFSDGLFRLFGEAPGAFVPDLRAVEARSHPDDVARARQLLTQATADRQPYHYLRRVYRPDGQLRTLEVHGQVENDLPGQPARLLGLVQDVTEREQATQELLRGQDELARRAAANHAALYNSMDEGFCVVEVLFDAAQQPVDYRFLDVNPAFEQQTGLRGALGYTIRELVPAIEPAWADVYGRVARTGEPMRFEADVESMGRWFDINAFPIGPLPNQHVAVLFTDITARKQAEQQLLDFNARLAQQVAERTQALGESQARLQSVFDSTTSAVALLRAVRNPAGQVLDFEYVLANPVAQAAYPGAPLPGQRYRALHPPGTSAVAGAQFRQVIETGRRADFEVLDDREGRNHWLRVVAVPLTDGLLYTAEDVTARKLLEQAQAEGLDLLQESEAVAGLGSWSYYLETRELTWSAGLYHLLGRPVGSPVSPQLLLDAVLDDDRRGAARLLRTLTKGTGHADELLRLRVGPDVKTVRCKAVPLPRPPGQPVRVVGVCLDVSDVARLEAENLALKLDRHKELLLAILQAQETERERLGEVLHNSLGQILYATKLHLAQLDTPALQALPPLASLYQQTNGLLTEAIHQTRTLAHELVPTSLAKLGLATAVGNVCRDLSTPQLRVECQVWGEEQPLPPPMQVALFRLAQELAHNIVRHAGATRALLELETLPNWVSLRAEDNGHGFDPHTTADGLGLRTVRAAVALLGGVVAIDSSPEVGTHIRLRIPLPLFSQA